LGENEFNIREMTESDLPEVIKLENDLFSDPWPESIFRQDIALEMSYPVVYQEHGEIAGYAILWVGGDEGHLTNIAVSRLYQRKSVAKKLLSHILRLASGMGLTQIILEVRPSNLPAISLYEKFGFEPLAVRKRYYSNPAEDCLVMRRIMKRDDPE